RGPDADDAIRPVFARVLANPPERQVTRGVEDVAVLLDFAVHHLAEAAEHALGDANGIRHIAQAQTDRLKPGVPLAEQFLRVGRGRHETLAGRAVAAVQAGAD